MDHKRFLLYMLSFFLPIQAVMALFSFGFFLLAIIEESLFDKLQYIVYYLALNITPVILIFLSYKVYIRLEERVKLVFIAYFTSDFILIFFFLFVSAAIAGTSMAYVEGAVGRLQLLNQEIDYAVTLTALSQILLIPWTLIANAIHSTLDKRSKNIGGGNEYACQDA